MEDKKLSFLEKNFSSYKIQFSKDEDLAEIINPFGGENIKVEYVPDDDFTPYIVYFAFQHCHMCDKEDIEEYIDEIVSGNKFSIEFFKNGARGFGTDITAEELNGLSYDTLEKEMGYWGLAKLKDIADTFKVRGWRPDESFDACFVIDENGNVTIQKIS